uniref:Uncharacterized protein n=1 Tax=Hanusia phi TaxID=3032 RepID=A0A7S0ERG3_9CRYP
MNKFTDEKCKQLRELASGTRAKLSMKDELLTEEKIGLVCDAILQSKAICELDFESSGIGDKGCEHIRRLVEGDGIIISLDLQLCQITDNGFKILAEALLRASSPIRALNLGQNGLTSQSTELVASLQRRYPLMMLLLKGNKIPEEDLQRIQQWSLTEKQVDNLIEHSCAREKQRMEEEKLNQENEDANVLGGEEEVTQETCAEMKTEMNV